MKNIKSLLIMSVLCTSFNSFAESSCKDYQGELDFTQMSKLELYGQMARLGLRVGMSAAEHNITLTLGTAFGFLHESIPYVGTAGFDQSAKLQQQRKNAGLGFEDDPNAKTFEPMYKLLGSSVGSVVAPALTSVSLGIDWLQDGEVQAPFKFTDSLKPSFVYTRAFIASRFEESKENMNQYRAEFDCINIALDNLSATDKEASSVVDSESVPAREVNFESVVNSSAVIKQ